MAVGALGLVLLGLSIAYLVTALGFPRGTSAQPGAGFYPVLVGAGLCIVAAVFTLQAARGRWAMARTPATAPAGGHERVAVTMAAVLGFCVLLPWIGYLAATFLFVGLVYWRLGERRWSRVLVTALATTAVSYYVFAVALGVPLPRGILFD
ncbi:MAG: tripartite tricarboxylate transporter TctB family protein [Candidatus Rokubacteria bacterium]|nr:tripartite tricarboxylate transporter TctB family protein [Candidatus Rokubacteria bacterium]